MTPEEDAQDRFTWFLVGVGMLLPLFIFTVAYAAANH